MVKVVQYQQNKQVNDEEKNLCLCFISICVFEASNILELFIEIYLY